MPRRDTKSSSADAEALGGNALAAILTRTPTGVVIVDAAGNIVHANPASCRMIDAPSGMLRGTRFLDRFPVHDELRLLAHLGEHEGSEASAFIGVLRGSAKELSCVSFGIGTSARPQCVVTMRDLTASWVAGRTAAALAQTTARLVGTGTTINEILSEIARHAVEGTRAISAGIMVADDHGLTAGGGYSPAGANFGASSRTWNGLKSFPVEAVFASMTGSAIGIGDVPGGPVVLPRARQDQEADPITSGYAERIATQDWQAACVLPLSWQNKVFGFLRVNLPRQIAHLSAAELAFCTALADHAAVAVVNARLSEQAGEASALLERDRLARDLHDSVSQSLFSMTMQARAAQLAMKRDDVDESAALGRSVIQISELAAGALAEMRALIFALGPGAVADEGLVGALRKQAALITSRESLTVTVTGPEDRLVLNPDVEDHLFRIASEALHNVVKHAGAFHATVDVMADPGGVVLTVRDDGRGFDPADRPVGHLGMSTMADRSHAIGAQLTVVSAPGAGATVRVSFVAADPTDNSLDRLRPTSARPAATDGHPSLVDAPDRGPAPLPPDPQSVAAPALDGSASAGAADLGPAILSEVVAGCPDGIVVLDDHHRYLYANSAACRIMGRTLDQLRGRPCAEAFRIQERGVNGPRSGDDRDAEASLMTTVVATDGSQREVGYSVVDLGAASPCHTAVILEDLTDSRVAARTAAALAQTTALLVGSSTITDIITAIACHAVEGTRALSCGISVMNDRHQLVARGGFREGVGADSERGWAPLSDSPVDDLLALMTGSSIVLGETPGVPVVVPNARATWARESAMSGFAAGLDGLDWQAAVCIPLSWMDRVTGVFLVFLPAAVVGPTGAELAFYVALAAQAAAVVTNAELATRAKHAAASLERARLARELHDSVSQALFSITMHSRAAHLLSTKAGYDEQQPLGRSVAVLGELARGAMAEMRALIFELRPGSLADQGLADALRTQCAAITARERTPIAVHTPDVPLQLDPDVEEHVYRLILEALHNAMRHAHAAHVSVELTLGDDDGLRVSILDDGVGFDPVAARADHLGLITMAQRAEAIGAHLTVASEVGSGTSVALTLHR
jgi:PAS domain S-box-containing protein